MNKKPTLLAILLSICALFYVQEALANPSIVKSTANSEDKVGKRVAVKILTPPIVGKVLEELNQQPTFIGSGSLIQISQNSGSTIQYVVTNYHVVEESTKQDLLGEDEIIIAFDTEDIDLPVSSKAENISPTVDLNDSSAIDASLLQIVNNDKFKTYGAPLKSFSIDSKGVNSVKLSAFHGKSTDSKNIVYESVSMTITNITNEKIEYEPEKNGELNPVVKGMSGGAILDSSGSIIGVHAGENKNDRNNPLKREGIPSSAICRSLKMLKNYCKDGNLSTPSQDILMEISDGFNELNELKKFNEPNEPKKPSERPRIPQLW